MGSCCARCMKFGEWKKYKGAGVYKGKALCGLCRIVVVKPKGKKKKKSNNSSRDRQRHLDKVYSR